MRTTKTARLLLLSGVATAALMAPAMALDAQAFVDRVAAVYGTMGYDFAFGPASLSGDTVTVDGVTVTLTDPSLGGEPTRIETEITFSGVAEAADGSYTAASVTVPDIDTEFGEDADTVGHLTLSDLRAENLYFPAGDTVPAQAMMQMVGAFSTGPLLVTIDGAEVVSIEAIEAVSTFNPAQGSAELIDVGSTLAINGLVIDLSGVGEEDPSAAATIAALGLTTITGNITQDATWTMADGRMEIREFLFDFADLGALNIPMHITGLTPAVIDQITAMQASMAAEGMTEEQSQAQMMSAMALMQGVSIVSASVRYDDASLAGNLLDYFASESGSDRASFVAGLKAMLPMVLAQSGIPALNDIVVPPVSAFLDDPQSLELKIAPPSPTSLLVLMAAAANPAGLITALGLVLEANTPAQ